MKKEQLEYTILISIGCAVLLYICFFYLLKPQWGLLKQNKKVQSELSSKLENARGKIRRLPLLKKNVKTLQEEITKEENNLLDNQFEIFVKMIKRATEKSGLKLNKIHPESNVAIPRSKFYTEKWVAIESKVPYHVLGKWIDELENQSEYIRIVKLSVTADKNDLGIHNAKVTVGFLTKTKN